MGPSHGLNELICKEYKVSSQHRVSDGLVAKSCLTLWDPGDGSQMGSSVHGVSQARLLEWVAISFSRGSSWPRDWTQISYIAGGLSTNQTTMEAAE